VVTVLSVSRPPLARLVLLAAAALAAGRLAGPAAADEIYAKAYLGQSLGYDDNPNFTFDSSGTGSSLTSDSSVSVNAGVRTPAYDFGTNATVTYSAFPQNSELNSVDGLVGATFARRFGLSRYGLRGNFITDTTRTTDEEQTGQFVEANSRRYVLSAGPFVETQLDPLNSLSASALYENQDRVSNDLPDSQQYSANALWTRILTPRTQAQASMNGFVYDSNSNGSTESQSIGLNVGFLHQFSPRLSARLLAGPVYSTQRLRLNQTAINDFDLSQSDTDSDSSSISYQVDSGLTYRMSDRTDFGGGFTRSSSPSTTSGIVTESNIVNLFVNHDLLKDVSVGARASYNRRTQLAGGDGDDDIRDLVTVSPNLTWQVQDDLRLTLNYLFRWQRRDNTGDTSISNGVFVAVNYELPRLLGDR
jgi:hypothetical protein